MSRFVEVVRGAADRPVEAIQIILGLVIFILGFYIAGPFYVAAPGGTVAAAFSNNFFQTTIVGLGLLLPATPMVLGLFVKKFQTNLWYRRSTLGMFVAMMFLTLLRLISIGFIPFTWILSLGLGLISAVCWAYWVRRA